MQCSRGAFSRRRTGVSALHAGDRGRGELEGQAVEIVLASMPSKWPTRDAVPAVAMHPDQPPLSRPDRWPDWNSNCRTNPDPTAGQNPRKAIRWCGSYSPPVFLPCSTTLFWFWVPNESVIPYRGVRCAQNHRGDAQNHLVLFSVITVRPVRQIRHSTAIRADLEVSRSHQNHSTEGFLGIRPKLSGSSRLGSRLR